MAIFDLKPKFFTEAETREVASRQILPFLSLAHGKTTPNARTLTPAPSKSLFSLDAFRDDAFVDQAPLFNWRSRPVFDIHGALLFYDHTAPLGAAMEMHVRTAASDLLRTPVWSIRAGRAINVDGLISKAISVIQSQPGREPVIVGNEPSVRLVCYSYPRLGIMVLERETEQKLVMDLWDLETHPLKRLEVALPLESPRAVWSPYDFASPVTLHHLRTSWIRNENFLQDLPELPERVKDLPQAIIDAGNTIKDAVTTKPELQLEGQERSFFCAAATASMILKHYLIPKSQDDIAVAMRTAIDGATPADQVTAISGLTEYRMEGYLDTSASFEEAQTEIQQNRPFKTGGVSHARACGGYLVEGAGKPWLYIYDPLPPDVGCIYYEAWEAGLHCNYMYVRPTLYF